MFAYVSDAKLADLLVQIDERGRRGILEKLRPTLGLGFTPVSVSVQPQPADRFVRNRSRASQVAVAEEYIRRQFPVGDLSVGEHWIAGRVDMEWMPLQDGETVLFCGYAGPLLVALTGSVGHLRGQSSSGSRTGSHSFAIRKAILDGGSPEHLGEALAAAARNLVFAPQSVRFLAQVIKRGTLSGSGPQREFLLGTPLYVEDAHRSDESADALAEGTVRWFSTERGWGLIAPDRDPGDLVVVDAPAVAAAGSSALTAAQRVEFRLTHGAAGVQATALRLPGSPSAEAKLAVPLPPEMRGQALEPADPRQIDRFDILRRLGEGSMGRVYLARSAEGGLAAVKVIRPEYARDPVFQRRFRDEGDSARKVDAPNVARVIEAVTGAGQSYLVTEFIDGATLQEQVDQHGPLPARAALEVSAGVAAALEAVHRAGIVHRDLSPSNVILSESGPKVIDFGIARPLDSDTRQTQAGRPIGTPAYMSPEQVDEGALTSASDIFSWAGLTAFALTGHQPFGRPGSPVTAVWREISDGSPDLDGVPPRLQKIIRAALDKNPARRPSAARLLERLSGPSLADSLLQPSGPASWLPLAGRMPRARLAAVAVTAVVLSLLASALYWLPSAPFSGNPAPFGPVSTSALFSAFSGAVSPTNAVILADESASITPSELLGEQTAARLLALGEFSPESKFAILGFGSAPAGAQPSAAVDQYCGLTQESTPDARQTLSDCAGKIHKRTNAQGSDTDFAAAFNHALAILGATPAGVVPLVFLLTDGQLDPGPYSPYGTGAHGAMAAQASLVEDILPRLRQSRVEVWPIGFGPDADLVELRLFAEAGSQSACPGELAANPRAVRAVGGTSTAALTGSIETTAAIGFAQARCLRIQPSSPPSLPAGESTAETVTIGPLTTLASIVVNKGDPRVIVRYIDPDGRDVVDNSAAWQSPGSLGEATYESVNETSPPLEALRLAHPLPGSWTVLFTDPPGVPAQNVAAYVQSEGSLTLQFVGQANGDPGHLYHLGVQPAFDSAPISPASLRTLTVRFQVTWPGATPVTLPGSLDSDSGSFVASLPVPSNAAGEATVTATATATGVQGSAASAFSVGPGTGPIVTLDLKPGQTIRPGGSVMATGVVESAEAHAVGIVFSLTGLPKGVDATLTAPRGVVRVHHGRQPVTVRISFPSGTRPGYLLGVLRWALAPPVGESVAPMNWLALSELDIDIQSTPPFWKTFRLQLAISTAVGLVLIWWFTENRLRGRSRSRRTPT